MLRQIALSSLVVATLLFVGCKSDVGNDGAIVGGSCVVSGECHIDSRCLTGADWPNGYCAKSCTTSEDCPDGSTCAQAEGGICVVDCAGGGECRSSEDDGGYACVELEARGAAGTVMGCVAE